MTETAVVAGVLGMVLGGLVLAVLMLHISHRRQQTLITEIRAQMAAAEIARMQRRKSPGPEGGLP